MATELQEATINTLEHTRKNLGKVSVSRAMRETVTVSGKRYSPATAKNPKILTGSKGFQEVYSKMGLTPGLITGALVEDIEKKPQNRLGEMRLGAEILKMNDKENAEGNKQLIIILPSEIIDKNNLQNGVKTMQEVQQGVYR